MRRLPPWPESAEAAFYRGAVSLWGGGGAELRFPVYSNPRRRPSLSYRVRGSRSAYIHRYDFLLRKRDKQRSPSSAVQCSEGSEEGRFLYELTT